MWYQHLLQVKQLEDVAAQGPPVLVVAPEIKAGLNADVDLSVLEAPHWRQDNLADLQQKWVQSLQRIKDCCTAQPACSTHGADAVCRDETQSVSNSAWYALTRFSRCRVNLFGFDSSVLDVA